MNLKSALFVLAFATAGAASDASAESIRQTAGCGLRVSCYSFGATQSGSWFKTINTTLVMTGTATPAAAQVTYQGTISCTGNTGDNVTVLGYIGRTAPATSLAGDGSVRGTMAVKLQMPANSIQPLTISNVLSIDGTNHIPLVVALKGTVGAGTSSNLACKFYGGFLTIQSPRDVASGLPN